MLKLSELETLKNASHFLKNPTAPAYRKELIQSLDQLIEKYENVRSKIGAKSKPLLEGELYELKVIKGLSNRQIRETIFKRRGVRFSQSTIEKAIKLENLIGKGKTAREFREKLEKGKNNETSN